MKNAWKTQIKRGHLVLSSGVGSIIRTQNGVTAVIAGLPSWMETIPASGPDLSALQKSRRAYLDEYEIRDAELEDACGVSRFIAPPKQDDEVYGRKQNYNWEVPLIRFPLAGVCENFKCQRLRVASASDSQVLECAHCAGDRKYKHKSRQVPIFLICANGHLDEVQWDTLMEHKNGCTENKIKVQIGEVLTSPRATCLGCGAKSATDDLEFACTGRSPWLPHLPNEPCVEKMRIVERTSVSAYYASTKSAIHIPIDSKYDESLLNWLTQRNFANLVDVKNDEAIEKLCDFCVKAGFLVSKDLLVEHVEYIKNREQKLDKDEEDLWDVGVARTREFDIMSGKVDYPALQNSKLIEFDVIDIGSFQHQFVGTHSLINGVTAVHRLTETRVLDGFSRVEPKVLTSREGYKMLWGHEVKSDSWLPGYRVHGEGILIEINPLIIAQRLGSDLTNKDLIDLGNPRGPLSSGGVLAHSLAHLLITALADDCGYQLPSIRDRIYDLADGRIGLMVYTAEGDSVGTLGGLVAFAQPGKFEKLLDKALEIGRWCPQDPVCIERFTDQRAGIHAACHQCLLLPETCCEKFNSWLDRSTIVGRSEKFPTGVL
jgi:hypothetical protein